MSGAGAEAAGVAGEPLPGQPGGQPGGHHHPARLEGIQPEVPVLEDGHPCQECGECETANSGESDETGDSCKC